MKLLQNKSTREIGCLTCSFGKTPERIAVVEYIDGKRGSRVWHYDTLVELNEDWEDYQGHEYFWYISPAGNIIKSEVSIYDPLDIYLMKRIGNYFESEEDAEKAGEKLKAWQRLKDNCFKVDLWDYDGGNYQEKITTGRILFRVKDCKENDKDLDLLFGGEK